MMLPNKDQLLFHVTEKQKLENIRQAGIVPSIGQRSQAANETEPLIYLFRHRKDMEDAVVNWLGEQFDDDTELVALEIQMPAGFAKWLKFDINAPYEVTYDKTIPFHWVKQIEDI